MATQSERIEELEAVVEKLQEAFAEATQKAQEFEATVSALQEKVNLLEEDAKHSRSDLDELAEAFEEAAQARSASIEYIKQEYVPGLTAEPAKAALVDPKNVGKTFDVRLVGVLSHSFATHPSKRFKKDKVYTLPGDSPLVKLCQEDGNFEVVEKA